MNGKEGEGEKGRGEEVEKKTEEKGKYHGKGQLETPSKMMAI